MRFNLLSAFILLFTTAFAQQSYYSDVDLTLSGMALKDELSTKITVTHTNNLSYTEIWSALKIVDLDPNNSSNILLVYGYDDTDGDITTDLTRNKNSNGGNTGDWNREHTYPKSLGTPDLGTSGPGADAHMLRPSDVQRNSLRGSKKFLGGTGTSKVVNNIYWYPGDEWKGDIARMMMYMYLRYGNRCLPTGVAGGLTVASDANMVELLLDWNAEDPVSAIELSRNDYLELTSNTYGQGNRNPFIDNPFLATRIWGGQGAEDTWGIYLGVEEVDLNQYVQIYPNPATDVININIDDNFELLNVNIHAANGQLIESISDFDLTTKNIQFTDLNSGIYLLQIVLSEGVLTKKLIVE